MALSPDSRPGIPNTADTNRRRTTLALALCMIGTATLRAADYYVSPSGKDTDPGTQAKPWQTISHGIAAISPGDTLHLEAGATFAESVYVAPGTGGSPSAPKAITSDAGSRAIIAPPSNTEVALYAWNTAGLRFENIRFVGPGMDIHAKDGVLFYADDGRYTRLEFANCEFTGFGKTGLVIGGWNGAHRGFGDVVVEDCESHGNRRGGMSTFGEYASANTNVIVRRCTFRGNMGDPAATSHTGSGIVLGQVTDGLIERCIAYGNGERCTTTGGPVGIWTFDSTRVTIQYCEAYSNRAAACDGGGFDIDGGCQFCTIQYCYSHDNDGAGYLICQYDDARAYSNNTVRYCISQNDGRRQSGTRMGGLHFYSSGSNGGLRNTRLYGNTVFASLNPAVYFANTSGHSGTRLWNNILATANGKELVKGNPGTAVANFQGNAYWSGNGVFNVAGYASLDAWRAAKGQEMLDGKPVGLQCDPQLVKPGEGGIVGDPAQLHTLSAYMLKGASPLIDRGLDLAVLFGVSPGARDFYGASLPQCRTFDVGAHESPDTDADGLPDDWEIHYFGTNTVADAASHGDTDGLSDLAEFEAGTDPTNCGSCLAITNLTVTAENAAVLAWTSAEGRRYAVESCTNLPDWFSTNVGAGIACSPPVNVYTTAPSADPVRFYRIKVER